MVNKGRVTLWPCHLHYKKHLPAKEELWKFKYFTMQKYNLQKKSFNIYNSISNLKFQHKPKIPPFKNLHIKIDLLLLLLARGAKIP